MYKKLIYLFKFNNFLELGYIFFLIGVFFLPSAIPIAGIFLLLALIISFLNQKNIFRKDNWDYSLYISIFLIFISTLKVSLFDNLELFNFNKSIIFISLFSWIPILISYFGFKPYLIQDTQKKFFIKTLIAGSFPVLISCILQKYFNLYGPFKTLYGSIIWFNKTLIPNDNGYVGGLTGLFSNPNYLGSWLTLVIPFSLALLKEETKFNIKKFYLYILNFINIFFALQTNSRNALFGIIITIFLMFNLRKNIKTYLFFIGIILFTLLIPISLDTFIPNQEFFDLSQYNLLKKFIHDGPIQNLTRIIIWKDAINLIFLKPLFGWGAGTFPFVLNSNVFGSIANQVINIQHTHNIILEIAYNFGVPLALLITYTVTKILYKAYKNVFLSISFDSKHSIYKAWITSIIVFIFSHLTDITYYDGKISLFICILFAGLSKEITAEEKFGDT